MNYATKTDVLRLTDTPKIGMVISIERRDLTTLYTETFRAKVVDINLYRGTVVLKKSTKGVEWEQPYEVDFS